MEHLDFILWMVLYPISCAICSLIYAKTYYITGEKQSSEGAKAFSALIILCVYGFVANSLY